LLLNIGRARRNRRFIRALVQVAIEGWSSQSRAFDLPSSRSALRPSRQLRLLQDRRRSRRTGRRLKAAAFRISCRGGRS
jgi:hypothetical protein